MPGWGIIPAIRVRDMDAAMAFYTNTLGFEVRRGSAAEGHVSLAYGDANLMIERPGELYGPQYNGAIAERMGGSSSMALYIEAPELEKLFQRVTEAGVDVVDPLGDRDWGQAEFTVADPEGNWLTFWKSPSTGGQEA